MRYPQAEVEDAVMGALRGFVARPGEAERLAGAVLGAIGGMGDARRLDDARARLREAQRGKGRLVDAIVGGVDPSLVQERLDDLGAEVRRLEAEVARLERVTVPDRDWAVSWVRERMPESLTKQELRRTVGRCELAADGTLSVEIPWSTSCDSEAQKNSELPARGQFRVNKFGGRYKI